MSVKAKGRQGSVDFGVSSLVVTISRVSRANASAWQGTGLCKVDFGFGFDDEEGVGVGMAGVAEFLAGFVEGVG